MKQKITLEGIDPIQIYGVGNKILEEFCKYFPSLKVVARGNELILEGNQSQIQEFQIRFSELVERRNHKMNLTAYDVEEIFDGEKESLTDLFSEYDLSRLKVDGASFDTMACISRSLSSGEGLSEETRENFRRIQNYISLE